MLHRRIIYQRQVILIIFRVGANRHPHKFLWLAFVVIILLFLVLRFEHARVAQLLSDRFLEMSCFLNLLDRPHQPVVDKCAQVRARVALSLLGQPLDIVRLQVVVLAGMQRNNL